MTFQQSRHEKGTNQNLFDSPADWISPNPEGGYRDNPPPADGSKVILTDTDHLWGLGCVPQWVWKSFTRGLNPILMDPIKPFPGIDEHPQWGNINHPDNPLWGPIRKQMGDTLNFAKRLDLKHMQPQGDLSSSTYCLANPGHEYLVYIPEGGTFTVDLSHASGTLYLEWFSVINGTTVEKSLALGGQKHEFTPPFDGEAVLYFYR
jgi:hypothetical protein